MTNEELYTAGLSGDFEIDDVRYASEIVASTINLQPQLHIVRVARMLAALREHYVKTGIAVAKDAKLTD